MIKNIIARLYLLYLNKFPIARGKNFIARLITNLFGTFKVKSKSGIYLELFLDSQMDISYIDIDLQSPNLILSEILKLQAGSTFIDIGANIGFYSLLAGKVIGEHGRVYSFEPSNREFKRLLQNIEINKIHNIIAYNLALIDETKEINLKIIKGHTGMNSFFPPSDTQSLGNQLTQGMGLDSIFIEEDIVYDLVKIDVEGAEYLVLKGMKNLLQFKRINKLIVEITPEYFINFGYDKNTLFNFMEELGYTPTLNANEWQYDEIFIPNKISEQI